MVDAHSVPRQVRALQRFIAFTIKILRPLALLGDTFMEDPITTLYADVVSEFSTLIENKKLGFLLRIAYRLTIVARDVFSSKDEQVQLRIASGISEINHQILGFAIKSISGKDVQNLTAEEVFLIVLEKINNCGLSPWNYHILKM